MIMDGRTGGRTGGRTSRRAGGRAGGRTSGRTGGRAGGLIQVAPALGASELEFVNVRSGVITHATTLKAWNAQQVLGMYQAGPPDPGPGRALGVLKAPGGLGGYLSNRRGWS